MRSRGAIAVGLALAAAACRSPDPQQALELLDIDTYWAVDSPRGETQYISPVVRFRLCNRSPEPLRSIQATATFRRVGEESQSWGSGWQQVTAAGKPLGPGQEALVMMKSDGRYTSTGTPESMFQNRLFKDTKVEVYVRIGSSGWVKMAEAPVERRIGARSVQRE
jgi:hypothetical protein